MTLNDCPGYVASGDDRNARTVCAVCGRLHSPRMVSTMINGRWQLLLPEHRHARPEWPWWEAQRLAAEHHVVDGLQRELGSPWSDVHSAEPIPAARPLVYCVGAEEGDFPALYASWGANVVLFEPNERVWPNIRAIFEANQLEDRVQATFAGFAGRQTVMHHDRDPHLGSIWPNCASGDVIGDHGFCNLWERPDIDSISLSWFVAQGERDQLVPDMITIDVEGAELEVLRGAGTVLKIAKPVVFVSIHPEMIEDRYKATHHDLHDFMQDHGYESRFLCTDHEEHWFFQHPDNRRMRLE